jgi:hypothetical protein
MATYPASNTLEALPQELKLNLLDQIPDVATLSALIHASPTYHELYAALREEILTSITLKELFAREIKLLPPSPFVEIRVYGLSKPREDLWHAIQSLYHQASPTPITADQVASGRTHATHCAFGQQNPSNGGLPGQGILKLTIEHCLALRTIEDKVSWRPVVENGQEFYRKDREKKKGRPRTYHAFVFHALAEHPKFEFWSYSRGSLVLWPAKHNLSCRLGRIKCMICRSKELEASGQATT